MLPMKDIATQKREGIYLVGRLADKVVIITPITNSREKKSKENPSTKWQKGKVSKGHLSLKVKLGNIVATRLGKIDMII